MGKKSNIRVSKFSKPNEMEYTVTINTDKELSKFIKRIENQIRSSLEYKDLISYVKEHMDMKKCAFYNNVESAQGSRVRIEIHHEPFTLYDIVKIVYNKHVKEGFPLNDLSIASEVMELHYTNKVGLVPLSKSLHQIIHFSNDFFIPLNLTSGEFKDFINEYEDYLDEYWDKIETKINQTRTFKQEMVDKLTPKYVYIEVDGFTLPRKLEINSDAQTA